MNIGKFFLVNLKDGIYVIIDNFDRVNQIVIYY